jgi:hypothetical protein
MTTEATKILPGKISATLDPAWNRGPWRRIKGPYAMLVIGLLAGLIIIATALSLPLASITVESREPYYVNDVVYQPYQAPEQTTPSATIQGTTPIADGFYTVVPSGIVLPFQVESPDSRLVGSFENTIPGSFLVYNSANRIVFEMRGSRGTIDLPLAPGHYKAKFQENVMWGEDLYVRLNVVWNQGQPAEADAASAGYRLTSVLVQKQRTVLREDRVSIWHLLFG